MEHIELDQVIVAIDQDSLVRRAVDLVVRNGAANTCDVNPRMVAPHHFREIVDRTVGDCVISSHNRWSQPSVNEDPSAAVVHDLHI